MVFPPWHITPYFLLGNFIIKTEAFRWCDEMVGWHHQLDEHEFEQSPGVGDGQGRLACCSPWGHKESDRTEQLNWTEVIWDYCCCYVTSVASDSVWPHWCQPTNLSCPWDSPGKNTGVGCHFLLPFDYWDYWMDLLLNEVSQRKTNTIKYHLYVESKNDTIQKQKLST